MISIGVGSACELVLANNLRTEKIKYYYMDNDVLPETKTLVFFIF